ncbi:MAG: hypothetical protein GY940_22425 [bacterium]|nr:hypothetical protein [bacterium]
MKPKNKKIMDHGKRKPADRAKHRRGFTVIETVVTMSIFFMIMFGVYTMVVHYGNVTKTEHARMQLQQEERFLGAVFADELKDAGAVLTYGFAYMLGNTENKNVKPPYYTGIFPLNNTTFPDGVIIATGDPEGTLKLNVELSAGNTFLSVEDPGIEEADEAVVKNIANWAAEDKGILIDTDGTGYYVFEVKSVDTTTNSIELRDWDVPVYYSGLLLTTNYYDTPSGSAGNAINYPSGSLVIKLSNFAIYLFNEELDSATSRTVRQLVRVTDTGGKADVLGDESDLVEKSIVSEGIYDLQISYVTYDDFDSTNMTTAVDPNYEYFAGGATSSDAASLLQMMRELKLKQIDLAFVTITDEYGGGGKTTVTLPTLGDRSTADILPQGKYGLKISTFSVTPRNYNIDASFAHKK